MEVDQENLCSQPQVTEIHFYNFAFHRLKQLKTCHVENIQSAVNVLSEFIKFEDFYFNKNNCLNYTLDFILTHSHFLIKKKDCGLLLQIMKLCADLFYIMQEVVKQNKRVSPIDYHRIFDFLGKLIESSQDIPVKVIGGLAVLSLLEMSIIIGDTTLTQFTQVVLNISDLFEAQGQIFSLSRLFIAVLKIPKNDLFCTRIKNWIEEKAPFYLIQNESSEAVLAILQLLTMYYKESTFLNNSKASETFNTLLPHLCSYMQETEFRITAEQLLEIVVYNLHFKDFNNRREVIMEEIQRLPSEIQLWPHIDTGVFFVIVYLEVLHNKCFSTTSWMYKDILEAMNRILLPITILNQSILKCLFDLYPLILKNIKFSDTTNTGTALVNILASRRTFPELLTYKEEQMKWLLRSVDSRFKTSVLVAWLKFQHNDNEIVKILQECQMGYVLVQFLVDHSNVPLASRVSQLVVQLKRDASLNKAVLWAMPFLCNRPKIIGCLVQVEPHVPKSLQDALNTIQTVSVCMTFFTDEIAVQAACSYLVKLIRVVGAKPTVIEIFCKLPGCIRFFLIKSCIKNDETAIAVLRLLKYLIQFQVFHKIVATNSVEIEFIKVLQGYNTDRLLRGLILLKVLLSYRHYRNLLIVISQRHLLELYHQIHTLIQKDTASHAFQALRLLSDMQPHLKLSLVTPVCLQLVCNKQLDPGHYDSFMKFLEGWLQHVTTYGFIIIPVEDLRHFLQKFLRKHERFSLVMRILNEYYKNRIMI